MTCPNTPRSDDEDLLHPFLHCSTLHPTIEWAVTISSPQGLPLTVLTFDNANIDEGFEEGTKETASAAVNFPPCSNGCKPCRHFISGRGCHLGDYCTYCHAQVHIVDMKKYQCKRNRKQKKKKSHRQTQEADNSSIQSDFKPIDCS